MIDVQVNHGLRSPKVHVHIAVVFLLIEFLSFLDGFLLSLILLLLEPLSHELELLRIRLGAIEQELVLVFARVGYSRIIRFEDPFFLVDHSPVLDELFAVVGQALIGFLRVVLGHALQSLFDIVQWALFSEQHLIEDVDTG